MPAGEGVLFISTPTLGLWALKSQFADAVGSQWDPWDLWDLWDEWDGWERNAYPFPHAFLP